MSVLGEPDFCTANTDDNGKMRLERISKAKTKLSRFNRKPAISQQIKRKSESPVKRPVKTPRGSTNVICTPPTAFKATVKKKRSQKSSIPNPKQTSQVVRTLTINKS